MTSTVYLERALVGSLLMYPERLHQAGRLTDTDFTDPTTHASWATLRRFPPAEPGPVNVAGLADQIAAVEPDLHPRLRSPAAIAELQAGAPYRPHIDTYAALIIDATIRREALAIARHLSHTPIDDVGRFADQATQARATVARLAERLECVPAIDVPDSAPRQCPARLARLAPPPLDPELVRAELTVLAAVIHDHPTGTREQALAAVDVRALQTPAVRAAWVAAQALRAASVSIDEVTTHWQLDRTQGATRLDLHQLRQIRPLGLDIDQAVLRLQQEARLRDQRALQCITNPPTVSDKPTRKVLDQLMDVLASEPPPIHPYARSTLRPSHRDQLSPSADGQRSHMGSR